MTIREKLADWISGGALSDVKRSLEISNAWGDELEAQLDKAEDALNAIIATDTPKAAHALKRAVKIAKGGLSGRTKWYSGYTRLHIHPRELP